jgi:hypothetical protein
METFHRGSLSCPSSDCPHNSLRVMHTQESRFDFSSTAFRMMIRFVRYVPLLRKRDGADCQAKSGPKRRQDRATIRLAPGIVGLPSKIPAVTKFHLSAKPRRSGETLTGRQSALSSHPLRRRQKALESKDPRRNTHQVGIVVFEQTTVHFVHQRATSLWSVGSAISPGYQYHACWQFSRRRDRCASEGQWDHALTLAS